ncbi:MAG TPA: sigma-70 family RNA polymerase sigma factor [Kofleriaceae bacterium]|nr:sigma-70 family RNA polymerase sigma factor [Kofleriaceae bacterium]
MSCEPVPWRDVASRLRPFVARRVQPGDVDDVLQDVFVRAQRGLGALRDDERMAAWLFQVARSAIAEHGRARARHPLVAGDVPAEGVDERAAVGVRASEAATAAAAAADHAGDVDDADDAAHALAGCVADFVARLPSPYREAVTLVELEGLTAREAAALAGVSVSGMKSRVQRGRRQLRALFEDCCRIALDARGHVTDVEPRAAPGACAAAGCRDGSPSGARTR